MKSIRHFRVMMLLCVFAMNAILVMEGLAAQVQKSTPFTGPKANKGFVTMSKQNGKIVLTLSDDFVVPCRTRTASIPTEHSTRLGIQSAECWVEHFGRCFLPSFKETDV